MEHEDDRVALESLGVEQSIHFFGVSISLEIERHLSLGYFDCTPSLACANEEFLRLVVLHPSSALDTRHSLVL